MRAAAIILIVLGVLGLLVGGFRIAYPDKVIDAGPVEVSVTKHKTVPLPPILGAVALVAGVGLLATGKRD
jgi:xanthosine utilization system XapX-like protein